LGSLYLGLYKLNRDYTSIVGESEYHRKVVLRKDDPILVFAEVKGDAEMLYYVDQVDKPPLKILVPVDFIDFNVSGLVDAMAERLHDVARVLVELTANRVDDHFMETASRLLIKDAVDCVVRAKGSLNDFSDTYEKIV
jgi:hypothetical protein